jgi:hypothetical protein
MERFKLTHPALKYVEHPDHDGSDHIWVPGQMIVCPTCQGTGSHVRHDLDDSALVDSMREDGDEEGLRAYFRGAFDERCTECDGENVVLAPYWESVPEWAQKAIESWEESRRIDAAIEAAERRMGA